MRNLTLIVLALVFAGCHGSGRAVIFIPNFGLVDVVVNDDPGMSDADDPKLCCSGLNVYVAYEDDRAGQENVYVNFSRDGARTFQTNDRRIDSSTSRAHNPRICCSGDRVYLAWEDERNDPGGNGDVFLNYSADAGVTWQANDIRIDTDAPGAGDSDRPEICCEGLRVYLVWHDNRTGDDAIFFNYSEDGGATFQASDIRLDNGTGAGSERICCDGLNVYVAWRDTSNGDGDILFNYSRDSGATWQANPIRVDTGDAAGANESDEPSLCCDGQRVYLVWRDDRNDPDGDRDVLGNYSFDGGATWQANAILVDNAPGDIEEPRICCQGLGVYAVWRDNRNALGTNNDDIFFSRSLDGGITWSAEIRLDDGKAAGSVQSREAQICCAGQNIHVAWRDQRTGPEEDIFYNHSTDGGATWAGDMRIDTDAAGASDSEDPAVCCEGARVYITYEDKRNDPVTPTEDIFVNGSP